MIDKTRHIDLTVPTSWNQCSTAQLELIAQILLRRMAMQDRYHPYDPLQMKTEAFFALAGLRVLSSRLSDGEVKEAHGEISGDFLDKPSGKAERSTTLGMTVKLKRGEHLTFGRRLSRLGMSMRASHSSRLTEPFRLEVWQVHSFVEQHLGWLDDFTGLLIFPYPTLGHYWTLSHRWPFFCRHSLEGPAPLLDGMTWRQYRFANEWLNAYTQAESREAREGFLKALFDVIDLPRTPRALRRLRPDQFQVVLIWWQSMMAEMQRKYRRCFKTENSGKIANRKSSNPVDLYTRSMATLQDKYHLTEDQINLQPCRVILQHLDDLAHEAEELEKINKKNKRHK